jgi:hypothetical protein
MSLKARIARLDKRLPPAPKSGPETVEEFLMMVRIAHAWRGDCPTEIAETFPGAVEWWRSMYELGELERTDPAEFRRWISRTIADGKLVGEPPDAPP